MPDQARAVESIRYDFIGMTNDPHATYQRMMFAPMSFPQSFTNRKKASLVELVDAFLRFGKNNPVGRAILTLNRKSYSADIAARNDFGEERLEFEVSEWQGNATAT